MKSSKTTLITSGELARLSNTTKRTIHHYAELGVLKPVKVNSKGYRFYEERQVLDYQMIHLLTTLGVPLGEIKRFLRSGKKKLPELFGRKQTDIARQIRELQFHFDNLEQFQKNLQTNGTLVAPKIITLKPFGVYYIERVGAYAEIEKFCEELKGMFELANYPHSSHLRGGGAHSGRHLGGEIKSSLSRAKRDPSPGVEDGGLTTLAIFHNPTYQPKKSLIWIGVLAKPIRPFSTSEVKGSFQGKTSEMKYPAIPHLRGGGDPSGRHLGGEIRVKPEFKDQIKFTTFSPGKVITYTHHGAGEILSLFWKELEKYCDLKNIKVRKDVPDFEIYRQVSSDPTRQAFEIYLPIE